MTDQGSIRLKRAPDYWELRLRVDGRQLSRSHRGTKDGARAAMRSWVAEVGAVAENPTMADALEQWYLRSQPRRGHRADLDVRRNIDNHLRPLMGRWLVAEVTPGRIEGAYAALRVESRLSPATIRKLHYVVRPALRLAVRNGWLATNPAEGVELDPLPSSEVTPPSQRQVLELIAAAPDDYHRLWLRLLVVTGGRRGEVSALQWGDVDWLDSVVFIHRALSVVGPRLEITGTKTRKSRRAVAVDPLTIELLQRRRAEVSDAGAGAGDGVWVFADYDADWSGATPTHLDAWEARWRRIRTKAGVSCRLHDLRHASASWLMSDGIDAVSVGRRLGHSRSSTTLDVYGHVVTNLHDRTAASLLAGRLDG